MCEFLDGCSWSLAFWYAQSTLPILIAIAVGYVAYQQHRTTAVRARLDLFDRRFRVVAEIRNVLSSVLRDADIKKDELVRFRSGVFEADFLFGEEVVKFIDDVYSHGLKLATANELHQAKFDRPDDYDVKKNAEEMDTHLGWLTDQLGQLKPMFRKYLDVSKL
jgi:hypothetical protein